MQSKPYAPVGAPPRPPQQPVKLPAFQIVSVTPVESGNLLAFLSVQIGRGPNAVVIHKWRLIQQPNQSAWISAPQEIWTDPDTGERRYKNLFDYPKEWRQALTKAAVAAWEEFKQEGGRRQ